MTAKSDVKNKSTHLGTGGPATGLLRHPESPASSARTGEATTPRPPEQARTKSEEVFRHVFDSAAHGMALIGMDGSFRKVNNALCEMLGYTEGELLATNFRSITHLGDLPTDRELARKVFAGEIPSYQLENRYIHKRGDVVWGQLSACVVRDSGGQPLYGVGQIQNITKRKQAEAALRESEERYRSIVETTADWIWEMDLTGHCTYSNYRIETILGYGVEEFKEIDLFDLLHIDDVDMVRQVLEECTERKQGWRDFVLRFRTKGGDYRFLESSSTPVLDVEGQLVGFRGVDRDITDRRRAEEALRRSEKQYRDIVETSHDLIWSADADGCWTFLNRQAAKRIWGYDVEEMLGRPFTEFQTAEQAAEDLKVFRRIKAGESVFRMETMHLRKDGSPVRLSFNAIGLRDEQGNVIGTTGTASDITEQFKLEAQLRQAQKMEAVGLLAGGVAHDFNNLLTVILGNLERAEGGLASEALSGELIGNVRDAARRATALTQRLLAFSRKQTLQPQVIDIDSLVAGMHDLLRRSLGETILIETASGGGLWPCEVDPGQLEHALLNLAINARDAMPNGGTLTIETSNALLDEHYASQHPDVEPGHYVLVILTDTGTGIRAGVLPHVFEPFYTTKEVGRGSGLGLSMVYGFVKQSGGHVSIDSEVGTGTVVKVYLPQARAEEMGVVESWPPEVELQGNGELILVVEDDDSVRAVAVRMLNDLGYETVEAENAAAALEMLGDEDVALLVTDVVMPGGTSGPELARDIQHRLPGLPVIFISGYSGFTSIDDVSLDPPAALIEKPFSKAVLARKVHQALSKPIPARIPSSSAEQGQACKNPEGPSDQEDVPGRVIRVLAVEDDPQVVRTLREGLAARDRELTIEGCRTAQSARDRFASGQYDVFILDVNLPDGNGFELVKELRASNDLTPVIMLTSMVAKADIVRALEAGADDYLTKPFILSELRARISALVRRSRLSDTTVLRFADVELDRAERTVTRNGAAISLTPVEFKLLETLMEDPGQVMSQELLLRRVWGMDFDPGTNLVRVHVSNLRAKLASDGGSRVIATVARKGYRMMDSK